jgi:hypothetical protein
MNDSMIAGRQLGEALGKRIMEDLINQNYIDQ